MIDLRVDEVDGTCVMWFLQFSDTEEDLWRVVRAFDMTYEEHQQFRDALNTRKRNIYLDSNGLATAVSVRCLLLRVYDYQQGSFCVKSYSLISHREIADLRRKLTAYGEWLTNGSSEVGEGR